MTDETMGVLSAVHLGTAASLLADCLGGAAQHRTVLPNDSRSSPAAGFDILHSSCWAENMLEDRSVGHDGWFLLHRPCACTLNASELPCTLSLPSGQGVMFLEDLIVKLRSMSASPEH